MYSNEKRVEIEKIKELVSLHSQVKALRFYEKPGNENLHEGMEKN